MSHIVFLDRDTVPANVRRPAFEHQWQEYPASTENDVVERLQGADIAITNKVPIRAAHLAQLPQLKMIAVSATGTDMIDLAECRARGIVVSNIRNYSVVSVPEHCMMLMLALRRNVRAYVQDVEAGKWQQASRFCLLNHPISDLAGSRLGIIGYGALGKAVARLGQAFGMDVCVAERASVGTRASGGDLQVRALPLEELLRTSDVVSLHVPLNEQTRHMIGAAQLASMKRTALLINTARGGLVDEAALAEALRNGVIGGAGFDVLSKEPPVPDNPLLALHQPNFILTPHTAWASSQATQRLADMLIDNIEAFHAGTPNNVM